MDWFYRSWNELECKSFKINLLIYSKFYITYVEMFNKLKLKKIRAFTILELTIVIIIIWVLMAATMRFGWDRISLLSNKNIQEQFLDNYSSLQSRNNMTNYYMWKIYQDLKLDFVEWEDHLAYTYKFYDFIYTGKTSVEWGSYKINKIFLDWTSVASANVFMKPYTLWCTIDNDAELLEIGILVNDTKQYCFKIDADVCRIRNVSCR